MRGLRRGLSRGRGARSRYGFAGCRCRRDARGRSGIDAAAYNRIEQGHSSPKLDTLIRIADAMRVEPEELVRR
ncbi:helix-turn-helix domain-containing protein [Streptomyces sp. AC512_CC834]|uniref:helix-turn-helix domain-containing protein n=1 Tax=Streptomyces sp. AC512_CC834 TaxID=2823691 RepID=UPI001C271B0E|nr:helix-turn-helix transcriptional regulator [Streptomyces sp. AC512_CC834]